ncbi:PTS glucose transporter subunit IIA [Spiroplasma endosymbiont of Crioceris asparagi]|uniref:PTS sugar transporter subunit IIA n=1 Tax=Spiroplasma endosymbiont of Crioceris asparagi TaxID=3066286 RepID=UPI0030D1781F
MGLFSKKPKMVEIFAPVDGELIELSKVNDEVFAEKMLGDGLAVIPANGDFISPADGELVTVFPSGHAFGLRTSLGAEILLHIGMDTVSLNGDGFDVKVSQGQKVKKGEHLVKVDLEKIKSKDLSIQTPIVFTTESMDGKKMEIIKGTGNVKKGDLIAKIISK